jgi:hypothetical protein
VGLAAIARHPTMFYWTSQAGMILRAESKNSDLILGGDALFAAPYASTDIVGQNLFSFIDGMEVRHLYRALSNKVLKSGAPISFPYRCDGPRVRREMSMRLSLDGDMLRYESALLRETPRERALPGSAPSSDVFVAICSFCQDYRFPVFSPLWKELEGLLLENDLPNQFRFTHGVCEKCYKNLAADLQ